MNLISDFEDSPLLKFIYHHMSFFLDHPIRRMLNDPVKKVEAAGIQPGMDVLEVGCGSGYFTIPAATLIGEEGHLYTIDIHPKAVEMVSSRVMDAHLRNVIITKTDALDTDFPSESYDLILLFGVIPAPVLPLKKLLPEMHRLLKPHGSIAVWTGLPLWSPRAFTNSRLFTYTGKRNGVQNFTKNH
jgi:demethylmenaquinone methyltransferase/2-methoxy-6-polyprenyl-1,4-benzoquinol methylase